LHCLVFLVSQSPIRKKSNLKNNISTLPKVWEKEKSHFSCLIWAPSAQYDTAPYIAAKH
jgi:hypothetical protein